MKKVYTGKTKDVYALNNGNCILKFKDDVTGENGVFDPGANTVGLSIEGIGRGNLLMSILFFEELTKRGIKTHYIGADADKAEMEVLAVKPFGQGLEVVCRLRAVGSFLKRYGSYIEKGAKLPYYVECTLKDDDLGDPLITAEGLEVLGIMDKVMFEQLKAKTQLITKIVEEVLAAKGLELYDIKFEFGFVGGEVILMDEIASGNMRVFKGGEVLDPIELTRIMLE